MYLVSSAASFLAGYSCRAGCGPLPCSGKWQAGSAGRPFKLSIIVHSATLEDVSSPGMVHDQRPYISLRVGDKTKETELGDWSKEDKTPEGGRWHFKETITVEVMITDELQLDVSCSTKYDLYVAAILLNSTHVGEAAFPVFSVFPKMKPEDRDEAGIVYATPVMPVDVSHKGKITARLYLSFETNQVPPSRWKNSRGEQCWGSCENSSPCHCEGDEVDLVACQPASWPAVTTCVSLSCVEEMEGGDLAVEEKVFNNGPIIGFKGKDCAFKEVEASPKGDLRRFE